MVIVKKNEQYNKNVRNRNRLIYIVWKIVHLLQKNWEMGSFMT